MSIFKKSTKKISSRQQIAIRSVRDGILELPGKQYRQVLQISPINFELKSESEQDALIDTYQNFLNSLATPLQILIRVREMDMDKYLLEFRSRVKDETEDIYRQQIEHYVEYVQSLVTSNKILTRHFYIVIPFHSAVEFSFVKEQLSLNADIVSKGLTRLGMQVRALDSLEVLDLFYSFYNPSHAKRQPLSHHTLKLLTENYL